MSETTKCTYTCSLCKQTHESEWTEAEALEEMKQNFGAAFKKDDCDVICDDCYKKFMEWKEQVEN